jgi:hypothetical protein
MSTMELVPSTANSTPVRSRAHSGPILSYAGPQVPPSNTLGIQGPPRIPPPRGNQIFRPYVSGFSVPSNGREQPFGMPTAMMANLHNSTLTYANPIENISSSLLGYGSGINNLGRNQPLGMSLHT